MGIFDTFSVNASGLTAERFRMDIIAENIANANTTRTSDGTPYVRKVVTFQEKEDTAFSSALKSANEKYTGKGVRVSSVQNDTWTEMKMVYDPSHPDADENGYVTYPNVDTVTEMTNLIDSSRAYEVNATAFDASKAIMTRGLELANA